MSVLGAINLWGIRQSSTVNIICTVVEAAGLLTVIVVGLVFLSERQAAAPVEAAAEPIAWWGVLQGSALAFFAFIGFEDMVNVSEEVKRPERNLPIAILTAFSLAAIMYIAVVLVATAVVPPHDLAASDAPLLEVVRRGLPDVSSWWFTAIALFAVANTGLLNFIMGSRLLYGMAGEGLLPRWLYAVHPKTETPHRTIGVVFIIAITLALSGTLAHLAGTTNVLLLTVFATVNVSLLVLKRKRMENSSAFRVPAIVPLLGVTSCLTLIVFVPWQSLLTAIVMIAVAGLIVAAFQRRG
jgi:amino acid transporter